MNEYMKLHWTCDKHQGINDDRCDCGDDHLGKEPVNELKTLQEEGEKEFEREWRLLFNSGDDRMKYPTQFRVLRAMIFVNREKVFKLGIMKGVELVEGVVKRNIEIENWSHSVGSHSDDRGGDSDIECTCREKEVRYKQEALNSVLSNITKLKQESK
jgi:hypothetical protein